jgi:hypothetical protein
MGTYYRDNLARQGHEDVAHAIYDNWQAGDREAAMAALPEDLLDQLGVWGDPETAREQFQRFTDVDGVEAVSVSFPRTADLDAIESTMRALAPE